MIVRCAWCKRLKIVSAQLKQNLDGTRSLTGWATPEDPDPSQPSAITDSICPDCEKKVDRKILDLKKESRL